ncbi:MAG TPA: putative collagen-binding domain-containing protein, partial [Candidatus Udaeobacter sp.]|nr:putative collagen-binding domain-containing protein [Candidatus Udaeobacter sp.]
MPDDPTMNPGPARGRTSVAFLVTAGLGFLAGFALLFLTRTPALLPTPPSAPGERVYRANPHYLTDAAGEPRFLLGGYRFFDCDRAEWQAVLDRAQAEGWNALRTIAIADGYIADGAEPDHSPRPFRRSGGGRIRADLGQRFNLADLDPRFWTSYAEFLAEAERRNLTVVSELFGVSGPFGDRSDRRCAEDPVECFRHNLWHRSNSVGGPANDRNAWQTMSEARRDFFNPRGSLRAVQNRILDRYLALTAQHANMVYQPVNELFGREGPDELDTRAVEAWLSTIRDAIRARHPGATVLLNLRALDRFPDYGIRAAGYDGITIHAPHTGNAGDPPYPIERMIAESRTLYPAGRFFAFDEDVGRPHTCDDYQDVQRQAAWTALTVGAGGYLLLENLFLDQPWCNRCDNPCPRLDPGRDFRHLARLLRDGTVRPWEMAPDSALVQAGIATGLGDPVRGAIVYLRSGPQLELDLTRYPGTWAASWFDPRRGEFGPERPVAGGTLGVELVPPAAGDWVLFLRR